MKIIASDFDGTFGHGGIDEAKRDAVKRWRATGNLIGLVSGRGRDDVLRIGEETGAEFDFFIANNGSVILDGKGNAIKEFRGDGAVIHPMVRYVIELGCRDFALYNSSVTIIKNLPERCKSGECVIDELPPVPYFTQITAFMPGNEPAQIVTDAVREKFGDVINPLRNGGCVDIVPAGVDKAMGIYALIEHLGAKKEDVITVGDNVNDKAMIAEFFSYAMDNAVDEIKALADKNTPSVTALIESELA